MTAGPEPRVLVVNGPNLAMLGSREVDHYGRTTQAELVTMLTDRAAGLGFGLDFYQSDIEGELVARIGSARPEAAALVINPAAYSHYSIAILDAMRAFPGPVVEVHMSRVFSREPFRRNLVTAAGADVLLAGAGVTGYLHALDIACSLAPETA